MMQASLSHKLYLHPNPPMDISYVGMTSVGLTTSAKPTFVLASRSDIISMPITPAVSLDGRANVTAWVRIG